MPVLFWSNSFAAAADILAIGTVIMPIRKWRIKGRDETRVKPNIINISKKKKKKNWENIK